MYDRNEMRDSDGDAAAHRLRAMSRIRKLLRLAEDQPGTPEGISALAMADGLMARHGISRSTLQLEGAQADFRNRSFAIGRKEAWRRSLVDAVADYFDCAALYRADEDVVETYGPEASLPQVEYTFAVYLRQLQRRWKAHVEELKSLEIWERLTLREQLDTRDGFCVSFAAGVKERLERDRIQEAREDPAIDALMNAQRRALERWMRRAGVRWRPSFRKVGSWSNEGFAAGYEADIDRALTGRSAGPRHLRADA